MIKLLLVDDEKDFRDSTAKALERREFEVRKAESGKAAIKLLDDYLPDLIILDLKMEEIDGVTTLNLIREVHGDLPVIILTGHGDYDSALAGIHLEIVDFLHKPVDIDLLAEKIHKRLSAEQGVFLKEKSVTDLMIAPSSYMKVYDDQKICEAMEVLERSFTLPILREAVDVGHRSVLVMNRDEKLVGMIRFVDILDIAVPEMLKYSPYSSFYTGMFLAQCKVFGQKLVGEYFEDRDLITISENTSLMETLYIMSENRLINLPVMKNGELVGILRDRDLFLEISSIVLGK